MHEIIQVNDSPSLNWIPEEFKDEFISDVLERYFEYAKYGIVPIHEIVYELCYHLVRVASYYETDGTDNDHFDRLIEEENENESIELYHDLMDYYYQSMYRDIHTVVQFNKFTCIGYDEGDPEREDFTHYATEVW